jgi:large subunit ribosomal protein L24
MSGMRIKKGDTVVVLTGKDKGKTGQVLLAMPKDSQVIVDGVNVAKRHTKQRSATSQAAIVDKLMPIHISNVAIAGAADKPSKVGYKVAADGKKTRINKRTGSAL